MTLERGNGLTDRAWQAIATGMVAVKRTGVPIPLLTRLKVRNLYLGAGLPHAQIAEQTGLTVPAVQQLVSREGLPKIRAERAAALTKATNDRVEKQLSEAEASIADTAEELALRGLNKVREAVDRGDRDAARDFQAYTGGVKNLVGVAKLIRSIDGVNTQEHGIGVSVFMLRCGDAKTERNVTPSVYDGI